MNIVLHRAVPILRMFDVAKAREFYVDYLGFGVQFEHRFFVDAPLFMGIARGDVQLFLSEHHGDGTPGTHIVVQVSGLDELLAELLAKPYRFYNPSIEAKEWGTRELGVIDPFGNHVVFSEPIV